MAKVNEAQVADGRSQEPDAVSTRDPDDELCGRDELRGRVDEARVQLKLADLDLRENVRHQLDTAVDVYLATKNRLGQTRDDAEAALSDLRAALERLLHDLQSAYEAAGAVIQRNRK